jgi:hypothetical protein
MEVSSRKNPHTRQGISPLLKKIVGTSHPVRKKIKKEGLPALLFPVQSSRGIF